MFKDYFGDVRIGRLKTSRFVVLWVMLVVFFILVGLLLGASIGIAEHLLGGDLATAQTSLRQQLAMPAIIAVALGFILLAFAKLNIVAKRARDIGLPGWLTAIIIAGLVGGTSQLTAGASAGGLGMLLLIVLAFIPTDAFRRA